MAPESRRAGSVRGRSGKRRAILGAAEKVFLESGYGGTSMDEIARVAGVSKRTVYAHFENKEALFGAMVRERCESLAEGIPVAENHDAPPDEVLHSVGIAFLDLMLAPMTLALYRTLLGDAARFPELGRIFYESGPERVLGRLARYLERQAAASVLDVPDPEQTAELFIEMLRHPELRALLGIGRKPTRRERDAYVRRAVELVLDGSRPKPAKRGTRERPTRS